MKRVGVFLLVLVLLEVMMCCEGCLKEERDALLALKSQISNMHKYNDPLVFWQDNTDCCLWEEVVCNATTGRVTKLNLFAINVGSRNWHLNYSYFTVFKDLKTLDLSFNEIDGCGKIDQGLENLEVLDLSGNHFDNATSMLSCLDGLSSLQSLSLGGSIYVDSFDVASVFETLSSKLPHLEVLDIGRNYNLTNDILPSLGGFTSLKKLDLSNTGLDSDLHIQGLCAELKNLEVLDISGNNFNGTDDITSALSGLPSLKSLYLEDGQITPRSFHNISKLSSLETLDLSGNNLDILWPPENNGFAWPINLQVLRLSYNNLRDYKILSSLSELRSLKSLDLSFNKLNQSLGFNDLFKFKKLEELDVSNNEFVGPLPSSLGNMTSLRTLRLDGNNFTGNIGSNLASLTSLEYLSFEGNQLEVPISFTPFANHSNLKFIHGNGNRVILDLNSTLETWIPKFQLQELELSSTTDSNFIPIPKYLFYQHNLTYVDFTCCKLGGAFPKWLLENNTKLQELHLENCSFTGNFQLPSRPHLSIMTIDVSRNAIQGSIPHELSHMRSLYKLDLSHNQFSGEIPNNLTGYGHQLGFSSLSRMLLSGNRLSGSIPSGFFNSTNLEELDISNNHFIGKIPRNLKHSTRLLKLQMSNNHFEGSIPLELAEHESITYLDLSENNLTGCIPSFTNSSVKFIHLSNNHLSGLSKRMFADNSSLVMLDLSYNELTHGIQDLIHDLHYTKLHILLIKGNHFTMNIPEQLCQLTDLSILDLSCNSFSGAIPNCLGKMPFEEVNPDLWNLFLGVIDTGYSHLLFESEKANFTSKKRPETYSGNVLRYMSGIDLSQNKLNGNIPFELGNLTRIRALNFSHNYLTGKIPATFSHLVQVESLDLSFNKLNGQIPLQLTELTSLEVFSVAHNNLSGATPERKGQFSTFDNEGSYVGNQFLCGPPLPKSCNANGETPVKLPTIPNTDEDNDDWMDMYVFCVSFVVVYISVLLVIAIVLYINLYWRQAWFYYTELVGMNCYYFIEDHF